MRLASSIAQDGAREIVISIRSELIVHAAQQRHERRFDFVWCLGSEFFRDLTATFDQLALP